MPSLSYTTLLDDIKVDTGCEQVTLKAADTPEFALYLEPLDSYDGSFGFDNGEIHSEYLNNLSLIQLHYERLMKIRSAYYLVPWLTPRTDASSTLSLAVRPYSYLQTSIDAKTKGILDSSTKKLKLESSKPALIQASWQETSNHEIEEDRLKRIRNIDITIDPSGTDRIEYLYIRTEDNLTVAKLRILFYTPLQQLVVPLFGVKENAVPSKRVFIKSLDQVRPGEGFIKSDIENTLANINDLAFRQANVSFQIPDDTIRFYDKNGNEVTLQDLTISGDKKIKNYTVSDIAKQVRSHVYHKIHSVRIDNDSTIYRPKGLVFLFFWPFSSTAVEQEKEGFSSLRSRFVVVKSSARYDHITWAHEIGHSLGLKHAFPNDPIDAEFANRKASVEFVLSIHTDIKSLQLSENICKLYQNIANEEMLTAWLNNVTDLTTKTPPNQMGIIEGLVFELMNLHFFNKYQTDNYMDYTDDYTEIRNKFYKYQWDLIRAAISFNYYLTY